VNPYWYPNSHLLLVGGIDGRKGFLVGGDDNLPQNLHAHYSSFISGDFIVMRFLPSAYRGAASVTAGDDEIWLGEGRGTRNREIYFWKVDI
jgi:hypothetical protein